MDDRPMTGIIPVGEKNVVFSSRKDSFEFCFLTDSINSLSKGFYPVNLPAKDGFVFGKMHDNRDIAIYVGSLSFEVLGSRNLITSAFIKSCSNLSDNPVTEFDAIRFTGGTLNSVFVPDAIRFESENGKTIVSCNDDSKKYTINMEEYQMSLVIRSTAKEQLSIHGNSITNSDVELMLEFTAPQPLGKLFEHYNRMRDLLSFMTFRENVGFDTIYLLETDTEQHDLVKTAEVFIRNEGEKTEKNYFDNITIDDLGETLPALIKLFYDTKEKEQSVSLGFFRANDRDYHITDAKIRAICSAIECELKFATDIKAEENQALSDLIAMVRKQVDDFQTSHTSISPDTYNSIRSGIGFWSFPLKERLCALYGKYAQEMANMNHSRTPITNEMLCSFVSYRNDITHGKHRTLQISIALTAHYLRGLVYCSILDRIGMSREQIQELCKEKILS